MRVAGFGKQQRGLFGQLAHAQFRFRATGAEAEDTDAAEEAIAAAFVESLA